MADKLLLNKYEYSLGNNRVCNYIADFGMLIYLQGSILPEIYVSIHPCECFIIIYVVCTSAPSHSLKSTSQAHLHIQIYRMVVDGYLHTVYFTSLIKKKSSNVTWMPSFPVIGINQMSIMQKLLCQVWYK